MSIQKSIRSLGLFLSGILFMSMFHIGENLAMKKSSQPRKFIIDTDAGVDDALAILLALKYEETHTNDFKIMAITCSHGNTNEKNVAKNVLKILTVAKRNDISVYEGAEYPLLKPHDSSSVFGVDGLGDFEFSENITATIDTSKYAAVALIDIVKSYPGEVSIIALGPLTNLALAIRLDSKFIGLVNQFIIMGSSVAGIGNKKPNVEFNFHVDPASSFIVLNSVTRPCILFPWETVHYNDVGKEWRINVFAKLNSSSVHFMNKAEHYFLSSNFSWTAVDAVTVATVIWPEMIKKSLITNVSPIYDGEAKGSVVVDYTNLSKKPHNAEIIQSYDQEFFKEKLIEYFSY